MIFIEIVVGGILLYLLLSMIEQKFLVTTKYIITSSKLDKEFDKIKFVVLADLHNHTLDRNNRKLIKRIDALSPDFILIAGDMITKHKPCFPSNAYSLLENLASRYQIYYAYGNHEQNMERLGVKSSTNQGCNIEETKNRKQSEQEEKLYSTWVEYKSNLEKSGVIFLDNQGIPWKKSDKKIFIHGISIDNKYFNKFEQPIMEKDYPKSLIGKKHDAYQILIAHNPVYFKDYIDWGADLIISGHIHGGIVRIPFAGGIISPQVKFFPKYDSGIYKEKNQAMVVSRGLGSHSFMPRLFNPPELLLITLKHE